MTTELKLPNSWYTHAPKNIWLHGIGSGQEATWADDPMPGGEEAEQEHAVGYVRDDLAAVRLSFRAGWWVNAAESGQDAAYRDYFDSCERADWLAYSAALIAKPAGDA